MTTQLAREELSRAAAGRPSAVTIGKFDGVHRGHRYLVGRLLERAREQGLASVVITIYPHPITVLRPGTPITYLCSLEERVALLRSLGVDEVGVLSFTSELAQLSYRDFLALLVEQLQLRLLLVGPDFALGRDRAGNVEALHALGEERGFQVEVPLMLNEGVAKVGSDAIRQALARGEMETVTQLLGRPFALRGPVVRGAERGQRIGFPTANIAVAPDLALPKFGVYVTWAYLGEAAYPSVTNIGQRPTFDESRPTVETHLLDFEGDCYERELRIELLHRLRDEQRFPGVEELVTQIRRDVAAARSYFQEQRP
ncbi:MAG: riboflavin biosynthesis protein RibF [Chloroflexi bacterium RBG_16_68_14]|nr:MAG: riboflavin biosynthesis protein RibF [Chloroflexi bacterium RBG_16_68_14]